MHGAAFMSSPHVRVCSRSTRLAVHLETCMCMRELPFEKLDNIEWFSWSLPRVLRPPPLDLVRQWVMRVNYITNDNRPPSETKFHSDA
jgi:hypothetical protein